MKANWFNAIKRRLAILFACQKATLKSYIGTALSRNKYRSIIEGVAVEHKLSPFLIRAICIKESALDTYAIRYEPGWRWWLNPISWAKRVATTTKTERVAQSISWGLMQIMGTVSRERGFTGDMPQLCTPATGVEFGCKHIVYLFSRYDDMNKVLSAYNTGRPNTTVGRAYADHVLTIMSELLKEQ